MQINDNFAIHLNLRTAYNRIELVNLTDELGIDPAEGKGLTWLQREKNQREAKKEAEKELRRAEFREAVALCKLEPEVIEYIKQEREKNAPHLGQGTGKEDWHTPDDLLALVRAALGGIDLDPASNAVAQQRVGAARYFTKDDDGLAQQWEGRVYLNPPYTSGLVDQFADKLVAEYRAGRVTEAIWLSNNTTDTAWFERLASAASAILLMAGRVKFWTSDADGTEKTGSPLQGQVLVYLGGRKEAFIEECRNCERGKGFLAVPAE